MKGDFTRDTFDPLKHFSRVLMQQGRVQLDADWNEQISILMHYIRTLATDLIGPYAGPEGDNCGFIITAPKEGDTYKEGFFIGKGRYYVNGILCENERYIHYYNQPDYEGLKDDLLTPGDYIVYLDVWERHITCIEDDDIREKALLGPDTTTRAKTVWQVKVKNGTDWESNLNNIIALSQACLRVRARQEGLANDSCSVAPEAQYRGAENQLYRVEIHDGGTIDNSLKPTFKWSRENGSVVFPIKPTANQAPISLIGNEGVKFTVELKLAHLGRDNRFVLAVGDWVEIIDDNYVLKNSYVQNTLDKAQPLFKVEQLDPVEMTVSLVSEAGPNYTIAMNKNPLLRRWEGVSAISEAADTEWDTLEKWIELENGIQIQFHNNGHYRTGDYWLIPARTATGDVEWPKELNAGTPVAETRGNVKTRFIPPHGVMHYFAPLATIKVEGNGLIENSPTPLRCSFPFLISDNYNENGRLGIGGGLICPIDTAPTTSSK